MVERAFYFGSLFFFKPKRIRLPLEAGLDHSC